VGANCQALQSDKSVETTLAKVYESKAKVLESDQEFLVMLQKDEKAQNELCLQAMKTAAANKGEVCQLAKEYRQMRQDFTAESITPQIQELDTIRDSVSKRISEYGTQYGGYAGAIVELFDAAELDEVRQLNPGKAVQVVPIKNVVFSFNAGIEADAALGIATPRQTALGYYLQGESVTTEPGGTKQAVTKLKSGQSVSLGIKLSTIGACQEQDLRTANFNYSYDTFAYVRGTVSYNKYDFYQKIKKRSTKGGFFTTKDVYSVSEESKQTETIKIAAVSTDETIKKDMEANMLKMLEQRLTGEIADKVTADAPALKAPGNGADAFGDALLKCPDYHCQIGGYVLKGLSKTFGNEKTEENARLVWDKKFDENWSETTVFEADDGASSASIVFKAL
jgi:hypothetical protein